jgi:hypothetical protein
LPASDTPLCEELGELHGLENKVIISNQASLIDTLDDQILKVHISLAGKVDSGE